MDGAQIVRFFPGVGGPGDGAQIVRFFPGFPAVPGIGLRLWGFFRDFRKSRGWGSDCEVFSGISGVSGYGTDFVWFCLGISFTPHFFSSFSSFLSFFSFFFLFFFFFFFSRARVWGAIRKTKRKTVRTMNTWYSRHSRHAAVFGPSWHINKCNTQEVRSIHSCESTWWWRIPPEILSYHKE